MSSSNTTAYSNLTNADTAAETTALAKAQIIQASATAMIAQANLSDQTVLSLLKYEFLSHWSTSVGSVQSIGVKDQWSKL